MRPCRSSFSCTVSLLQHPFVLYRLPCAPFCCLLASEPAQPAADSGPARLDGAAAAAGDQHTPKCDQHRRSSSGARHHHARGRQRGAAGTAALSHLRGLSKRHQLGGGGTVVSERSAAANWLAAHGRAYSAHGRQQGAGTSFPAATNSLIRLTVVAIPLLLALLPSPQVDSLEQALLAALPLGPQAAAGGVSLPELFRVGVALLLTPCAQLWAPLC